MKMSVSIGVAVWFVAVAAAVGAAGTDSTITMKDYSIIRCRDGITINLGDDGPETIKKLGLPLRVSRVVPGGESYPGQKITIYITMEVYYPGLYFEYYENNGRIYWMEVLNADFRSYRGGRIGMTFDQVLARCPREGLSVDRDMEPEQYERTNFYYYALIAFDNIDIRFNSGPDQSPPVLGYLFDKDRRLARIVIQHP